VAGVLLAVAATVPTSRPSDFTPIADDHLPNARYVTSRILAGAQPEGHEGFQKLRDLGVKTIISVDGALPDVEKARRYGLRYVHLPITYSGVTDAEGKAIAKALLEVPGPVYLHCHHGKHRAAAAAAVACVMTGDVPPERAESILQAFGTGANYKGLWAAARAARPADRQALHALEVDFVERAKLPPLAEAMVDVDRTFDRLKLVEKAGWRTPADHPDLDPPHEALQLHEHFRELRRADEVRRKPAEFQRQLEQSERDAAALEAALTAWKPAAESPAAAAAPPRDVTDSFRVLGNQCTACHKAFRD
jgi:protein tyrosine phosphatase (PTP) superfamily phosphohydrolase (DUF442 family)